MNAGLHGPGSMSPSQIFKSFTGQIKESEMRLF